LFAGFLNGLHFSLQMSAMLMVVKDISVPDKDPEAMLKPFVPNGSNKETVTLTSMSAADTVMNTSTATSKESLFSAGYQASSSTTTGFSCWMLGLMVMGMVAFGGGIV
jgi:hypothetical protein